MNIDHVALAIVPSWLDGPRIGLTLFYTGGRLATGGSCQQGAHLPNPKTRTEI